jgi:hypothetical protein
MGQAGTVFLGFVEFGRWWLAEIAEAWGAWDCPATAATKVWILFPVGLFQSRLALARKRWMEVLQCYAGNRIGRIGR